MPWSLVNRDATRNLARSARRLSKRLRTSAARLACVVTVLLAFNGPALASPGLPAVTPSLAPLLAHEGSSSGAGDRELISMALGLCGLVLVVANRKKLMGIPGTRWWVAALLVREVAWTLAVLHGLVAFDPQGLLEAALLMVSTGLIMVGTWRTFVFDAAREGER
jgi:hypothetical protein